MPIFHIQTPNGQTLDIEARDPMAAIEGAHQWSSQQEKSQATQNTPQIDNLDKYQQAAKTDMERQKSAGLERGNGLASQFVQGATFGLADEALAALNTPIEMFKRGTFNPSEGYNYAKAREDAELANARTEGGALGTAAEIVGGIGTGGGLLKAGKTFMSLGAGIARNLLGAAGDGAVLGGAYGFNEGSGLEDRLTGAATGAAVGGVVGAAVPAALMVGGELLSPVLSNIGARRDPTGYTQRQIAKAVVNSGRNIDDISAAVKQAQAEGQGVYTLADELGTEGQNLLSVATNSPGAGRDQATRFLEGRQFDAPRRLQSFVQDGFEAPKTASQTREVMQAERATTANRNYSLASEGASPVDVGGAVSVADNVLNPGANAISANSTGISRNTIQDAASRARSLLTDGGSQLSDFQAVLLAKQNIDDMIISAPPNQQRVLLQIKGELDSALENASPAYRQANDTYANQSAAIDAIDTGVSAARRGRFEDTIPQFNNLSPEQQQPFRVGYADDLITGIQGRAQGAATNAARPLQSPAYQAEIPAFAVPGKGETLMGQIAREDTMAKTGNRALRGSTTVSNLNNQGEAGIDPGVLMNLVTGNFGAAAKQTLASASNAKNGLTPQVRENIAKFLLANGSDIDKVANSLLPVIQKNLSKKDMLYLLLRGAQAGGTSGTNNLSR